MLHPEAMRGLATLLFLSVASWAGAQSLVHGVIADFKTHEVLPFVHVFHKDTLTHSFVGTVSSTDGRFSMKLPREADSLEFSCLGYRKTKHCVDLLRSRDTVFLREESIYLPSVIVTPLTATELIQTCIDKIPDNYRNTAFINTCFVWQATETNSEYQSFHESLVTLHEAHLGNNSRYTLLKDSSLSRSAARALPIIPPLDSIYKLLYFDFARAGSGILNAGTLREWAIRYADDAGATENHWVVDAERKDHLQHARIYIDPEDYAFRKIEFGYRWRNPTQNKLNDTLYYSLQSVSGTLLYEKTGRHYGVKYIILEAGYTTGSTDLLRQRETPSPHKAVIEYVVIESQEIPVRKRTTMAEQYYSNIAPAPVDRERYQRIKDSIKPVKRN